MDKARDDNLRSTAQEVLNEYRSPTNNLTYREILDKHAAKIAPDLPAGCGSVVPAYGLIQLKTRGNHARRKRLDDNI